MAVTEVQHAAGDNGGANSATCTATFGSGVTGHNAIAVCVNFAFPACTVSTVTDSKSNTYTRVTGSQIGNASTGGGEWWVCKDVATGGTGVIVTATTSNAQDFLAIIAVECTGQDTATAVNGTGTGTFGTNVAVNTEFSGTAFSTTVAGCLGLTGFAFSNNVTGADPAGYTRVVFSGSENVHAERIALASSGSWTPKGKNGGGATNDWYLTAIALAPPVSGATLTCAAGSLTLAGGATGFVVGNKLACAVGSLTLAGGALVSQTPRVVSAAQIAWQWGNTSWNSPGTITVTGVQAGDTLIAVFEGWFPEHDHTPTDSNGTFSVVLDQGTAFAGTDHVYASMYVQENAAAGTHVITPPNLDNNAADDGTFYVLLARGLKTASSVRATGSQHATGSGLTGNTVALTTGNAAVGDLVVAISCYDNTTAFPAGAGYLDPPSGWISDGVQNDASLNVPSEIAHRIASAASNQSVSWTWNDTGANITSAVIAAFKPLGSTDAILTCAAGSLTLAGGALNFAVSAALACASGALTLVGGATAFDVKTPCAAGALTFAGGTAAFDLATPAATGSLTFVGGAATFISSLEIVLATGTLSLVGGATAFDIILPIAVGTLAFSGGAASSDIVTPAAAGSLALAGGAVEFRVPGVLVCGTRALALAGQAATFNLATPAAPGTLALAGGPLQFNLGSRLAAAPGTLIFAGGSAFFLPSALLACAAGHLTLAGRPALFLVDGALPEDDTVTHVSVTIVASETHVSVMV